VDTPFPNQVLNTETCQQHELKVQQHLPEEMTPLTTGTHKELSAKSDNFHEQYKDYKND
jgi:hypothetical protein